MKVNNIIISGLTLLLACAACKQLEIPTYNDLTQDRYLYFSNAQTDVTTISFVKYPGSKTIEFPVSVKASGFSDTDASYKISFDASESTASASDCSLPSQFVFHGNAVEDSFNLTINYSDKMDNDDIKIVLRIEESDAFKVGPTAYATRVLLVNNKIVKPDWWVSTSPYYATYYFGTYTEKKYRTFLEACKVNLDNTTRNEIRYYATLFKKYLMDQKAAGHPVLEDNGTEMTLPI